MSDLVEVTTEKVEPAGSMYSASGITLYGSLIVGTTIETVAITMMAQTSPPPPSRTMDLALVYGYAYQGHCYSLPEPIILVVDPAARVPNPNIPGDPTAGYAIGCGFDAIAGYYMWRVDKLHRTVEFRMAGDTYEEIVLNKNTAGTKQPASYAGKVQMLHRGGRLE